MAFNRYDCICGRAVDVISSGGILETVKCLFCDKKAKLYVKPNFKFEVAEGKKEVKSVYQQESEEWITVKKTEPSKMQKLKTKAKDAVRAALKRKSIKEGKASS